MTDQSLYAPPRASRIHRPNAPSITSPISPASGPWATSGTCAAPSTRTWAEFDFKGKQALDVGTASGFLSFEMERQGAEVVSFDIPDGALWNYVPFAQPQFDRERLLKDLAWHANRIKNSYWLAHRTWGSRARVHYGDIYELPEALGTFDVVVFGMVLPTCAIRSAPSPRARACRGTA